MSIADISFRNNRTNVQNRVSAQVRRAAEEEDAQDVEQLRERADRDAEQVRERTGRNAEQAGEQAARTAERTSAQNARNAAQAEDRNAQDTDRVEGRNARRGTRTAQNESRAETQATRNASRAEAQAAQNAARTGAQAAVRNTERSGAAAQTSAAASTAAEAGQAQSKRQQAQDAYIRGDSKSVYKVDQEMVDRLKTEMEQNQLRFLNTVKEMLGQQGINVSDQGIWKTLARGNYQVDAETQAQARRNISEDGYWGVEQTSDRIVKYAVALSGGDPDKLDTMIAAFEKGYQAAEKAWGGTLPSISQQTRDAVYQKFDDLKKQYQAQNNAAQNQTTAAVQNHAIQSEAAAAVMK